jgi:putative MATE family efflux protein
LRLMGADAEVIATGKGFTQVMLGGSGSLVLLFIINAAFRGAGDATIAMRTLIFANTFNMVLGPCLIFGLGPFPRLGVEGAAIATTTGRSLGVIYQLYRLAQPGRHLSVGLRHIEINLAVMRRLLSLSGAGTLQHFVSTASWIGTTRLMSSFGAVAVAGYTIGIRVIIFGLLPCWGIANAAATLVGQSLGAQDPERARQSVWRAGFINFCVMGLVGLSFVLLPRQIAGFFTEDPQVLDIATTCLRIIASGYLFYAYGMVFSQAFNGAGDAWTPMFLNIFCFWCGQLPVAWVLSQYTSLRVAGVPLAVTLAFSLHAIIGGLLFRRGRWASRVV